MYARAMTGDPYVRETQRRVRRHERSVEIVMLIIVAALLIAVTVSQCGSDPAGTDGTCLEGQACE